MISQDAAARQAADHRAREQLVGRVVAERNAARAVCQRLAAWRDDPSAKTWVAVFRALRVWEATEDQR